MGEINIRKATPEDAGLILMFIKELAKFEKMENEFNSGYKYKFDVIRNIVLEFIHYGLNLRFQS